MNRHLLRRFVLVFFALALIAFLSPVNAWWVRWYVCLGSSLLSTFADFGRIVLLALTFAGFLAPFEALSWWAGWYGEQEPVASVPILSNFGVQPSPLLESKTTKQLSAKRYVVYLDGIAQSTWEYSPRVTVFLQELKAALSPDIVVIHDIMAYSVINRPLTFGRPLAAFWRWTDRVRNRKANGFLVAVLSIVINLRNMFQVAVSIDGRYGPIFNRGTAQTILNSLLRHGYQLNSGTPVTLIGYSGGGQVSLGAVPYLKRAIAAPLEVISIAGVIGGNTGVVQLEHLYHLVGSKDKVARYNTLLLPQRWSLLSWSNWNLAKSRGKISIIPLGPVAHDSTRGPFARMALLPDGRSHLRKTLDLVTAILTRTDEANIFAPTVPAPSHKPIIPSNYELYVKAAFNQPSYYPSNQSVESQSYQLVGRWIGRLILPEANQRSEIKGVFLEIYHAPPEEKDLVGQVVNLRWNRSPMVQAYVRRVKVDMYFTSQAKDSVNRGWVHPERLNYWRGVDPLESLAGARPNDDVIVKLREPVAIEPEKTVSASLATTTLYINREPIVITGRFYGLVTILHPLGDSDRNRFLVRHYNSASGQFDGKEEVIRIPEVVPNRDGVFPSTTRQIERSPLNSTGWYIYGARDRENMFVVGAIAPRSLFQLQPHQIISGKRKTLRYIHHQYWQGVSQQKGKIDSILLNPLNLSETEAIAQWQEGDRLLVMHVFGGIAGKKKEFAPLGIFFGHFAFGFAKVVRDPISRELRFEINYRQVYTQNPNGIIAATLDWTNYMGDRQWGWLGTRPVVDILVKLDALEDYDFGGQQRSLLHALAYQLYIMMARYRTGDGTGATFVGSANSCVQDSCQALYRAIQMVLTEIKVNPQIQDWLKHYPEHPQTQRLQKLIALSQAIERKLVPWGEARTDWQSYSRSLLGTRLAEQPIQTVASALTSWRSLLPRLANDELAKILLRHGASLWLLRTNQVGGFDPDIEPLAPTKLWL